MAIEQIHAINVLSIKGGVGKTTVAINLAVALGHMGRKVLLIDGDPANASIAYHLHIDEPFISIEEAVLEMRPLSEAIIRYKEGKIDVIPGMESQTYPLSGAQTEHLQKEANSLDYEYVIVDTSPGIMAPQIITTDPKFLYHSLIVSTPYEPTIKSNKKLIELLDENGMPYSMILNRNGADPYGMSPSQITKEYDIEILQVLPEDEIVPRSISKRTPAFLLNKNSEFSKKIAAIAKGL